LAATLSRIAEEAVLNTNPQAWAAERIALALAAAVVLQLSTARAEAGADQATMDLYKAKCQICHTVDGNSPLKPMNLADGEWLHGDKVADHVKVIENGVPGKAMRSFKDELTKEQILALAKYVQSFDKGAAAKGGKAEK
jgi:mono/diheme cytochrome c family protein